MITLWSLWYPGCFSSLPLLTPFFFFSSTGRRILIDIPVAKLLVNVQRYSLHRIANQLFHLMLAQCSFVT